VAVGRTAVAVGGIADSGLMVRLTRGRLWIGLLATLLVGIVGLNVAALSFSARSSVSAGQAEALQQRNSALRAQLANQLSTDEVEAAALGLGMLTPAPGAINYLKPGEDDAAVAAKRLRDGDLTTVDSAAVVPLVAETTSTAPVDDAVVEPVATETAVAEATPAEASAEAAATTAPVDQTAASGAVVAP
jgi:hypothetical protein